MKKDPYKNSVIVQVLNKRLQQHKPLRIACLDLDSTMTGKTQTVNKTRRKLEELGFVTIFITSRTEEIVMTKDAYDKSISTNNFLRPEPHMKKKLGKFVYVAPEKIIPQGLLNPQIIAGSTGTKILLLQQDGSYSVDYSFELQFGETSGVWRQKTLDVLSKINKPQIGSLNSIDIKENYFKGKANVFPPDFRIQVNFSSLENKSKFIAKFVGLSKQLTSNIRIFDDSKPNESGYTVYLTPIKASKTHAVEHIIEKLCIKLSVKPKHFEIFFAGDSFPDLHMGLNAGSSSQATLLLVGNSRLSKALTQKNINSFAGEKIYHVKQRLFKSTKNGYYQYEYERKNIFRKIIVGDKAFANTKAVETVYSYLESISSLENVDSL